MLVNPTWALVLGALALLLLIVGFNRSGLITALYGRQKPWLVGAQLFCASSVCSALLLGPAVWLSGRADVFWAEAAALLGLLFLYWRLPWFWPRLVPIPRGRLAQTGAVLRYVLEWGWVAAALLQMTPLLADWPPWLRSWGVLAFAVLVLLFAASGAANLGRLVRIALSALVAATMLVFLTGLMHAERQAFNAAWLSAPPWSINLPALALLAFTRENVLLAQQRWLLSLPNAQAARRAVLVAALLKAMLMILLLGLLSGGGTLPLQPRPGVAALAALAFTHSAQAAAAVAVALLLLLLAGAAVVTAPLYVAILRQLASDGYADGLKRVLAVVVSAVLLGVFTYHFDWLRQPWSEAIELIYGLLFASLCTGRRFSWPLLLLTAAAALGLTYAWREWWAAPFAPSLTLLGLLLSLPALLINRKHA